MASLRPEFEAALRYFARASKALIDLGSDGTAAIISVEDIIADRMGQFASGSAPDMLAQAAELLALHSDIDRDYLDRRVRKETVGDYGIDDIKKTDPA